MKFEGAVSYPVSTSLQMSHHNCPQNNIHMKVEL